MKVESIAECSLGAFCNTFDLHLVTIGLEYQFVPYLSGCLRQVTLYVFAIAYLKYVVAVLFVLLNNLRCLDLAYWDNIK